MQEKQFTLKQYALISAAFLLTHNVDGEIVYTDIEPDIILDVSGETAFLDIDNNGVVDFAFLVTGGTYPTYNSSSTFLGYARKHYVWAGPYYSINEVVGNYIYHSFYGGSFIYMASQLNYSEAISAELHFQNAGFQIMAGVRSFQSISSEWIAGLPYGDWFDSENQFLDVYFADNDNLYHYGWIRCSVSDSADQLTIKDYAYNTAIETGLLAGTLISGMENGENDSDISIYTNSKNVHIHSEQAKNGHLLITNLSGKAVLEMQLSSEYEVIDMQLFPAGMYIVKINWSNRYFTQKINIY